MGFKSFDTVYPLVGHLEVFKNTLSPHYNNEKNKTLGDIFFSGVVAGKLLVPPVNELSLSVFMNGRGD